MVLLVMTHGVLFLSREHISNVQRNLQFSALNSKYIKVMPRLLNMFLYMFIAS